MGKRRFPGVPNIPTVRQQGAIGTRSPSSIARKVKTPEERLDELERAAIKDDPEVEELFRRRRRR